MNRQFPALSGLAMLLIVLNHTIELGTKMPAHYGFPQAQGTARVVLLLLQALGVFAVPTFLFISGAFISYAARGNPPRLSARFLGLALSHICWPYFLWSLLFYAVILLQLGERYTVPGYLKNLVVGYPFHFIPLLLFFYLLSPLLVRLGARFGAPLILAFAAYQVYLLIALQGTLLPPPTRHFVPPVVGRTMAQWAVYFPLGLIYGMHSKALQPKLKQLRPVLLLLTLAAFVVRGLYVNGIVQQPLAADLAPLPLVLLLPVIERGSLPAAGFLEGVGKRSYGLYLTHLLVLDLILWGIGSRAPMLFNQRLALLPALFFVALSVPLLMMNGLARSPARSLCRYVFG
jgi:surface polysaccharide O-acyltransferase-like enzyme